VINVDTARRLSDRLGMAKKRHDTPTEVTQKIEPGNDTSELDILGTEDIWTIGDVARWLRVHPTTIYRLVKKRDLPGFKVGSDWRFRQSDILRWLDERRRLGAYSLKKD
jgi:excisionase family DNA binding protein